MNIIVYGNNDDTSLDDIIFKTLARYGDVQFFSKDKLVCSSLKKSQPCKAQEGQGKSYQSPKGYVVWWPAR